MYPVFLLLSKTLSLCTGWSQLTSLFLFINEPSISIEPSRATEMQMIRLSLPSSTPLSILSTSTSRPGLVEEDDLM